MSDKYTKGIFSFLVGGAIGTAIGLLVAPEKGEKLRRRVAFQLEHLADKFGEYLKDMGQEVPESEARKRAIALTSDATHRADQIKQEMDALMDSAKRRKDVATKDVA